MQGIRECHWSYDGPSRLPAHGNRGVTPETTWMLASAFKTSPEVWIDLQAAHDLAKARQARRAVLPCTAFVGGPGVSGGCPVRPNRVSAISLRWVRPGLPLLLLAISTAFVGWACHDPALPASGRGGAGGAGGDGPSGSGVVPGQPLDPGHPALRRLTNLEYDDTVRDLLGVPGPARAMFPPDERPGDFDVIGEGQSLVTDVRYEQYVVAAESLAAAAFADPALRKRIMMCETPDGICLTAIVTAFGRRAWRRPLADEEVKGLVAMASSALTDGATLDEAVQDVVMALLSSAPFLLHIEFDPNPGSIAPHPLSPYEFASRLSYLVWSSMPGDDLLARGLDYQDKPTLEALVDSMLDDPRAAGFVDSFASQWLDFERVPDVQIDPVVQPSFVPFLRASLVQELRLYFTAFLDGQGRDFRTFPSADLNFVNWVLASYYGVAAPSPPDAFVAVTNTGDARAGYLGLGGFLALTSVATRTSPTARGDWILRHLLCMSVPPAPPNTPDEISSGIYATGRALVDSIHAQAACAGCHDLMDGVGVALEAFDEMGRFRTAYLDGTPVDTRGSYAGQPVDGELALAVAVGRDPAFPSCAIRKLLSFAVNRTLDAADAPVSGQILSAWTRGTPTMRALLKAIVTTDAFTLRRGDGP